MDTMYFCMENPEVPLIEALQYFHFYCGVHNGHSLIDTGSGSVAQKIISEKTFIENMNNPSINSVNYGIFRGFEERYSKGYKPSLELFNKIERI